MLANMEYGLRHPEVRDAMAAFMEGMVAQKAAEKA